MCFFLAMLLPMALPQWSQEMPVPAPVTEAEEDDEDMAADLDRPEVP